jgi:hypothetical protein
MANLSNFSAVLVITVDVVLGQYDGNVFISQIMQVRLQMILRRFIQWLRRNSLLKFLLVINLDLA